MPGKSFRKRMYFYSDDPINKILTGSPGCADGANVTTCNQAWYKKECQPIKECNRCLPGGSDNQKTFIAEKLGLPENKLTHKMIRTEVEKTRREQFRKCRLICVTVSETIRKK